jgi:hypothetical protein
MWAEGLRSLTTSARGRCPKPRRFFSPTAESDEEVSEGSNKRRKHHNPWCAFFSPLALPAASTSLSLQITPVEGAGSQGWQIAALACSSFRHRKCRKLASRNLCRCRSIEETEALVMGVEQCGGGKWADIKKLGFQVIAARSAVDLKDKWRNLMRVALLPSGSSKCAASPLQCTVPMSSGQSA